MGLLRWSDYYGWAPDCEMGLLRWSDYRRNARLNVLLKVSNIVFYLLQIASHKIKNNNYINLLQNTNLLSLCIVNFLFLKRENNFSGGCMGGFF